MRRTRYVPRTVPLRPTAPFASAEEAWFWFARCQRLRREGGRLEADAATVARPCDPDDVCRAALGLRRVGVIRNRHLAVLARFGLGERPPDGRRRDEADAARLWDEALDRMTTVLRAKGIVE